MLRTKFNDKYHGVVYGIATGVFGWAHVHTDELFHNKKDNAGCCDVINAGLSTYDVSKS